MSPELERVRQELETRLMWPYTFKSKLMAEFERLVREDERAKHGSGKREPIVSPAKAEEDSQHE